MAPDLVRLRVSAYPTAEPSETRSVLLLEETEKAITELPAHQLASFRAWFEEFEAARFDQRIERDAKDGRLDQLAAQAISDFRAGRAREL